MLILNRLSKANSIKYNSMIMSNPPDILTKIITTKRAWVQQQQQHLPLTMLQKQLAAAMPELRGFKAALQNAIHQQGVAIIAEIKKASPSKGVIRADFDPVRIAQAYEQHGAACISVLTDEAFFQGRDAYLTAVRAVCSLPLLRKDFIIDPYQIYESRLLGADCILLIVAALTDVELQQFTQLATSLGLAVLVEVHDAAELQRALRLDADLIGINNRDLRTFVTDLNTTRILAAEIPAAKLIIAESGIETTQDIHYLQQAGVNAFLIGETFMRAPQPGQKLAEFTVDRRAPRS